MQLYESKTKIDFDKRENYSFTVMERVFEKKVSFRNYQRHTVVLQV